MLKKGGIYKQYKVIKTDGKRAIIKDATFSSNRKYVLSFLQNKNHFINLSNLNLPGFDMLPSYRTMKYKSPIWGDFHV